MDKNAKQFREAKAKQEETALNRVLCWIAGGSVLEFLLLLLNRYYSHYTVEQIDLRVALGSAVKILAVAALVCAAAAGLWWNAARKSGRGSALPGLLTIFMAGVSVSCFCTWFMGSTGLRLMYIGVPVVIVLALIYYLYQREFFLVACLCVVGLLGIWVCSRALGGSYAYAAYLYLALAAVVTVGGALVCRRLQAGSGAMELKGKRMRILPKDANYALLYVTAIVTLLVLIAAVLAVPTMILFGVVAAWVLIMAVYYTVKLM